MFRRIEEENDRRAAREQRRSDRVLKDYQDELVDVETKDIRRRSVPTSNLALVRA